MTEGTATHLSTSAAGRLGDDDVDSSASMRTTSRSYLAADEHASLKNYPMYSPDTEEEKQIINDLSEGGNIFLAHMGLNILGLICDILTGWNLKVFLFVILFGSLIWTASFFACWFGFMRPQTRLTQVEKGDAGAFTGSMAPIQWKCCPCDAGVKPCIETYCCPFQLLSEVFGKALGCSPAVVGGVCCSLYFIPWLVFVCLIQVESVLKDHKVKGKATGIDVPLYSYPEGALWVPGFVIDTELTIMMLSVIIAGYIRMNLQRMGREGKTKGERYISDVLGGWCCHFWCCCSQCAFAQEAAFLEAVEETAGVFPDAKLSKSSSEWDKLSILSW